MSNETNYNKAVTLKFCLLTNVAAVMNTDLNKMSITSLKAHCVTVFKSASCNMQIFYSIIYIVYYISRE